MQMAGAGSEHSLASPSALPMVETKSLQAVVPATGAPWKSFSSSLGSPSVMKTTKFSRHSRSMGETFP